MNLAHHCLRAAGIVAAGLLAPPAGPPSAAAADAPPPAVASGDRRARVAQTIAGSDWGGAQLALMEWLKREPDNPAALLAQAELFEKQGDDELAYAVIAHAVALAPGPSASAGGAAADGDPAAFAAGGQVRREPPPALWATYRGLQSKLYHPDEAPPPTAGAPAPAAQPVPAAAPAPPAAGPAVASGSAPPPAPALPPACPEDAEFARDARGQWAVQATASSAYGETRWSAGQATGAPDVAGYGDNDRAWASKLADAGEEWLRLTFARPVRATAVRVRQTLYPGAIAKVEVFAADGRSAVVWAGRDPTAYPRDQVSWFVATFVPPPFPVQGVTLTLDSAAVYGWNEIDAVQLVGE